MGDGSFGFTAGELETITRHKVPLLMIVLSNGSYGWIKASQKASYGERYFSVDFSRTEHARIASGYGVTSWKVEDPQALGGVLRQAAEHGGPRLVATDAAAGVGNRAFQTTFFAGWQRITGASASCGESERYTPTCRTQTRRPGAKNPGS